MANIDEEAVDELLNREPENIVALVIKADCRSEAGDDRTATRYYQAALAAAGSSGPLPQALMPFIQRAQAGIGKAAQLFESHLETSLRCAGLAPNQRPARFQKSLDILSGRQQANLQLQRPSSYFYPDLPQRRFYERSEFTWAKALEEAAGAICGELAALTESGDDLFKPYITSDPLRQRQDLHGLVDNLNWSTLYLWEKGQITEEGSRCPMTLSALRDVQMPRIGTRAPSILFSRLRAGARIPPHSGMLNARLICHLPLIVPSGCGFRVGGETRQWREHELLVFDDSVEHEAWNDGRSDRYILIFDIWRPELDEAERSAVTALFSSIDEYGGA